MRRSIALFLGGFLFLLASACLPFGAAGQDKKPDQPPAKPRSLEEMQAEALKNSHDVKVAQARLRLAEAELERTRAIVKAQIVAAHADLEAALASENEGETRYKRAEVLYKTGDRRRGLRFGQVDVPQASK